MFLPAMPAAVLLQEPHVGAAALRAGNATGPAPRDQVFAAIDRVGEKDDGLLQCCWLDGFHTANLAGLLILSSILVPCQGHRFRSSVCNLLKVKGCEQSLKQQSRVSKSVPSEAQA